ncbi:MYB-like transcription factor ETC3 [Pyrus ussuriensis x Pyrus communis]|uniref:MYB-like transcription factor ETC3 n=1 Tax=Pyrus ussuriensis x Pyrus communis TaxID=2448454 RepID=A0A5N5GFB8_9ROSA|nr:MYB-like transcription factor ETC3 [Pyrus ussuriensis x Pyrus communis]
MVVWRGKTVVESEEKGEMGKFGGKRWREGEKVRKQGDEIEGGRKGKREEGEEGRAGLPPTPSRSKRSMVKRVSEVWALWGRERAHSHRQKKSFTFD